MVNVTFELKCCNNWHIHKSDQGGGQILLCTDGCGWYQEEGKEAVVVITIPTNVNIGMEQVKIVGLVI